MLKRGYKLKDIQFGDDNRAFNIDRANNCIVQTMASIKDMPKSAPEALYELGKSNIKNRAALYQALMDDPRINKKPLTFYFILDILINSLNQIGLLLNMRFIKNIFQQRY